jgi:hypothetical protein
MAEISPFVIQHNVCPRQIHLAGLLMPVYLPVKGWFSATKMLPN